MLVAHGLTLKRHNKIIINQIDLRINSGEILGVLGTNGAGKSTLVAGLSGDLASQRGELLLHNKPLQQWFANERAKYLAVLLQTTHLNFAFSVKEVVGFGRLPHKTGILNDNEIIMDILKLIGIEHLVQRNYLELSGGERQRVHLARVLAQLWPVNEKSVFLLDEPTSMLDPLHQHTLLKIVQYCANQGAAVMIVLHDLNLAARYCNQLIVLEKGEIRFKGSPSEVLTTSNIRNVFGLDVFIQPHPTLHYPMVIAC